jgi:hypothetical protein
MFKKIPLAIFISCISASSFAYQIGTNLTVENNTDVPMLLSVELPKGQAGMTQQIPAHKISQIYMTNGDHTGLLNQTSTAPFKITGAEDQKMYVQGRVVYYVGRTVWNKYIFLNSISVADGLQVDPVYTCKNGGNGNVFENKLVIDGVPGKELVATEFPIEKVCQGLKSSTLDQSAVNYAPVCFDGEKITYVQKDVSSHYDGGHYHTHYTYAKYSNAADSFMVTFDNSSFDKISNEMLHAELDKVGGNAFCSSW